MMIDYPAQDRSFTLTRILAASRQAVFTAWTDPEHLAWFYNPDMPTPTTPIEVDLRVGGTWRQQMVVNGNLSYPTGGSTWRSFPANDSFSAGEQLEDGPNSTARTN